jgi:hypothetical protein
MRRGLVLLDDRADLMYLTQEMRPEGSATTLIAFQRPLIRSVYYYHPRALEIHVLDGWRRVLTAEFWRLIALRLIRVRDFRQVCDPRERKYPDVPWRDIEND